MLAAWVRSTTYPQRPAASRHGPLENALTAVPGTEDGDGPALSTRWWPLLDSLEHPRSSGEQHAAPGQSGCARDPVRHGAFHRRLRCTIAAPAAISAADPAATSVLWCWDSHSCGA